MGTSPSILQDKIVQYEREREERVRAYDREREERLNRFTRERSDRMGKVLAQGQPLAHTDLCWRSMSTSVRRGFEYTTRRNQRCGTIAQACNFV